MSVASVRREYRGQPLTEATAAVDPFEQFARWFEQARSVEADPTAMTLATATADGIRRPAWCCSRGRCPRLRVLHELRELQGGGDRGRATRRCCSIGPRSSGRSASKRHRACPTPNRRPFASRPLESRWSAHASPQSRAIDSRESLEAAVARARDEFGDAVPRPAGWGGFRVSPDAFEFWQGRENRLHDRLAYTLAADGWRRQRLAP
jgi:pyridoxamine 5'-phosphate oxidase